MFMCQQPQNCIPKLVCGLSKLQKTAFFFRQLKDVFVFVCVTVCVRVCGVRLSVGSMCKPDLSLCKTVNAEKSGKR